MICRHPSRMQNPATNPRTNHYCQRCQRWAVSGTTSLGFYRAGNANLRSRVRNASTGHPSFDKADLTLRTNPGRRCWTPTPGPCLDERSMTLPLRQVGPRTPARGRPALAEGCPLSVWTGASIARPSFAAVLYNQLYGVQQHGLIDSHTYLAAFSWSSQQISCGRYRTSYLGYFLGGTDNMPCGSRTLHAA